MIDFPTPLVPTGWQCPVCRRVYSPTTPQCFSCPGGAMARTGTSGDTAWMQGRPTIVGGSTLPHGPNEP